MAESEEMRERLRRALAYPYVIPQHSFMQVGERTIALTEIPDLTDRRPLLAYGSNAAPEALVRKLAAEPSVPLPLIRAELAGYDVVYSDHLSPYGAVPGTLQPSLGTSVATFVAYPTERQRDRLAASEPNYEERRLTAISRRPERGPPLTEVHAFLTRHDVLRLDGSPVALAAIPARGRTFPSLDQAAAKRLKERRASRP